MKINPKDIHELIGAMYSDTGWVHGAATVKAYKETVIKIDYMHDTLSIVFTDALPKLSFTKLAIFSVSISSIILKPNLGTICLKGFPDINFKYEQ